MLFGIYLLGFSGRLHSIDEHSMLAVTESVAKGAGVRTDQNLWHVDFQYPSDTFGVDGHFYSKKGPATALLAIPSYWAALKLGNLAPGHAALLSTAVISALTGAAMVLVVNRLGLGVSRSIFVALAWGLTTMAWPYARYFFSEPTAALFLLLGFLCLIPDRSSSGSTRGVGAVRLILGGAALGVAATTRVVYVAAIPLFALYLVLVLRDTPRAMFGQRPDDNPRPASAEIDQSSGQVRSAGPCAPPSVVNNGQAGDKPPRYSSVNPHACRSSVGEPREKPAHSAGRQGPSVLLSVLRWVPWPQLLTWGVGVLLPLLAYGAYNAARFGNPLNAGFTPDEQFSLPTWEGMIGLLASPGRSVFLFSPLVAAGVLLWRRFERRFPAEGILVAGLFVGHLLIYGSWYMWWGGLAWGPRFLVPLLPFAVLPVAVLPSGIWWRLTAAALSLGGWLVNSTALLASFTAAKEATTSFGPANWSIGESSLVQQFRLARLGAVDVGWWRGGQIDWLAVAVALSIAALGAALLASAARRYVAPVLLAATLGASLLAGGWSLTRYFEPDSASRDIRSALRALNELPDVSGVILGTPQRAEWLAIYAPLRRPAPIVANNSILRDGRIAATLENIARDSHEMAYAVEYTAPGDQSNLTEVRLSKLGYQEDTRWFGDEIRLVTFRRPAQGLMLQSAGIRFGDAAVLERYAMEIVGIRPVVSPSIRVHPGDRLGIRLDWRPEDTQKLREYGDLTVFAHVERTAEGLVLAQRDRQPLDGLRPTTSWKAGEAIPDLFVIRIPDDAPPNSYDIVVGLYQPASGSRLPAMAVDGASGRRADAAADAAVLGTVEVTP